MSKFYKCIQCGDEFEGTGKPGRPYQNCPRCRGMTPISVDSGTQELAIRHSSESGVWAVVGIKNAHGKFVEARLSHKQLLEYLSRVLLVLHEREQRKEK